MTENGILIVMRRLVVLSLLLGLAAPALCDEGYGAKGIYPVYEAAGRWVIFDKKPGKKRSGALGKAQRFLVVGSAGARLFSVEQTSMIGGGICRGRKPALLPAAILSGPRAAVGRPIIGIKVPASFSLKGSRAVYTPLTNQVSEATYAELGEALRAAGAQSAPELKPDDIRTKIDFGAPVRLNGLGQPFVFVEETQTGDSYRRCLRLASGGKLVGDCAEMPRTLMAETGLLQFVSYDPSGSGNPFLLAFTTSRPLWGDERWAFTVRSEGPRLFLMDAMDPRCREGF